MIRSTVSVSHAAGGTRAVHLSDFNACFLPSSPCALTSSTVGHGVLMVTSLGLERRPVLSTAQSRNLHTQMHKDTQTQTHTHTNAHTHMVIYCYCITSTFTPHGNQSPGLMEPFKTIILLNGCLPLVALSQLALDCSEEKDKQEEQPDVSHLIVRQE